MGRVKTVDPLTYEVKLYELEDGRWNFFVYRARLDKSGASSRGQIYSGTTTTEAEAVKLAQREATKDRQEQADGNVVGFKTVVLK